MKLKYKFLIIFLLLSNIPLILITWFAYNRYTSLLESQLDQISENLIENAVDAVDSAIVDINRVTEIFTFYSESKDSIVDDLKKYTGKTEYTDYDVFQSNKNIKFICQNLIYSSDYINGIFVFTPSGEVLGYGYGNNIDIYPDYSPFEDKWYKNAVDAKGKIITDGINTKNYIINAAPSITFYRALYDVFSHEFLGVLVTDCSPGIFDLGNVNTMPDNVMLSIQGGHNQILYSNADLLPYNFSNHSTIVTKKPLSLEPLTLVAAINYDALYKEFGASRLLFLAIAVVCVLVLLVISILLSSSITKPISYLSRCMSNHDSNNYITETKYLNKTDEIGTLFNEYNAMLQKLNSYIKREYQNKLITLDSQMKSLEAQINSHFLYNTLESINSIAEIEEVESISIMSMALGNMFRYSIKTQSELVTIADELSHVKDYISIQQIRFSYHFKVLYDIPEEMLSLKVLKLIMQPIVENALYHGLNYCSTGDCIKIACRTEGELIYITISDNGCGMDGEQLEKLRQELLEPAQFKELGQRTKQSIGLKNIHSRIELYYGQSYGLSISSVPDEGTTVTLRLPLLHLDRK